MKKVKTLKGYVIAVYTLRSEPTVYFVFTSEEWAYGAGLRSPEWEAGSLQEAIDWIG